MTKKSKDVRLKQLLRLGICGALIALIALIGAVMVSAEEPEYSEGLEFTSNGDGTCYVSGIGTCTDTELIIPPVSPAGDTVTAIGGGAFYNCVSLETVMVPASVTHIHFEAFKGCTGLTSVQFAGTSQLTSIESEAFMGCKNLEDFTIPASVNNIMSGTLDECPILIDFEDGVGYVDQWAVTSDSDITQLILREDTVGIAWGAFASCENLFSVSFPESVKYINESAFGGCSSLTDVVIPAGVVTLQQAVFNQCYFLTRAWILTNDPSAFQSGVFVNSGLDYAYLVGTEEEWKDVVKSAFYTGDQYRDVTIYYNTTFDVNGIAYTPNGDGTCSVSGIGTCTDTEIVIPPVSPEGDAVTSIGNEAFSFCSSLTSIAIPNGVTSIGDDAFYYCSNLTSIAIPKSVTSIGNFAFSNCSSLTSVTIPDSVTSIGEEAFYFCTSLTSIVIPDSVTSISGGTFSGCTSLTSIVIPNSVTSIGEYAFFGSGLTNIAIPNSVTSIGNEAFSFCSSLTSIAIPNSVTSISFGSFARCDRLADIYFGGTKVQWKAITIEAYNDPLLNATIHYNTTLDENGIAYTSNGDGTCYVSGREPSFHVDVVIPSVSPAGDTVTAIGEDAFAFANIKSVQLPDTLKLIGGDAFSWNNSLLEVSIPASVTYIGAHAFGSCETLRVVDIPANSQLTCIDSSAFYYCYNLIDIIIPETVTSIGASAFAFCHDLEAVIPKSVTYIGDYAFQYTAKVTFAPDSPLTEIGEGVFMGCHTHYFILPSNIKTIGDYAFQGCDSQGFFFPAGLTEIGYATFDAEGAIWFYYEGTEEAWNKITIGEKNEALFGTPDKYFLGDSFFTGASLTLGESLTMNYYSTLESVFGQATVRFTYRGETFTVKGVRDKESGEYVFSLTGIAPQCMGENIKAELILTLEDGTELVVDAKESYSVRAYCRDALAANPDNKALVTLLADLLAYGDAAQDYTGFNADTPVSEGFAAAPSEWEAVTDTDFTLSDKTRDDIRFTSAGVRFGHINRLYFKVKAADLTGVTLTVNDKTYTAAALTLVEDTADTYIFYTDPVYATEFDKVFTAELSVDGEVIQTLTYSVRSYVYAKQNSENTEMAALVRALYAYGRSAIAYKQEQ